MNSEEQLMQILIKTPNEVIRNTLVSANYLCSHCYQCRKNQEKFGTYPYQSNLRGECLDLNGSLDTDCTAFGYECKEKLEKWLELCSDCECAEGNEVAKKIKDYFTKIISVVREKKLNGSSTQFG